VFYHLPFTVFLVTSTHTLRDLLPRVATLPLGSGALAGTVFYHLPFTVFLVTSTHTLRDLLPRVATLLLGSGALAGMVGGVEPHNRMWFPDHHTL
jgi:argininosuccinate lyase